MQISKVAMAGGFLLATIAQAQAGNVDAKLLGMLLANGSITAEQHAELMGDLQQEQKAQEQVVLAQASKTELAALQDKLGWVNNTKLKGDVRVRQEVNDIEGEADNGGRDKDRQRVRARLGVFTQINPEVEIGIQAASGNSNDQRSTNQDLDNYFTKKSLWLDLAYIDYHPQAVEGLKLVGGKMKQPWFSAADLIWDGDINPEGFAASYSTQLDAATVFGSGGYYVLKDNVDGEGVEINHDLNLYALQIGTIFAAGENVKLTLGASYNDYDNEKYSPTVRTNGNTTDTFELYELFGQMDIAGLPVPLSLYTQYVVNEGARDFAGFTDGGEDTGWLFGLRTTLGPIAVDYNYRDVEANAVVGAFADSDFASGYVASSGHKLKLKYDINKNFSLGTTYFLTESDAASRTRTDADVNTLQVDVEAKF